MPHEITTLFAYTKIIIDVLSGLLLAGTVYQINKRQPIVLTKLLSLCVNAKSLTAQKGAVAKQRSDELESLCVPFAILMGASWLAGIMLLHFHPVGTQFAALFYLGFAYTVVFLFMVYAMMDMTSSIAHGTYHVTSKVAEKTMTSIADWSLERWLGLIGLGLFLLARIFDLILS